MSKIEEKIEKLIKEKVEMLGYDLYDVEYTKEGKNYFLRVFIDKDSGIDINDCEIVNDAINDLLDEADYIKEQYFLEVSSPGIERVLRKDKHLKQNIGNNVQMKLFKKDNNGNKNYEGVLQDFDKETVTIKTEEQVYIIDRKEISTIKTVYNW